MASALGITCEVVDGAAIDTNISVPGLEDGCLIAVLHEDGASGVTLGNLLSEASIPSSENLQLSTTDTTGDKLLVWCVIALP